MKGIKTESIEFNVLLINHVFKTFTGKWYELIHITSRQHVKVKCVCVTHFDAI